MIEEITRLPNTTAISPLENAINPVTTQTVKIDVDIALSSFFAIRIVKPLCKLQNFFTKTFMHIGVEC